MQKHDKIGNVVALLDSRISQSLLISILCFGCAFAKVREQGRSYLISIKGANELDIFSILFAVLGLALLLYEIYVTQYYQKVSKGMRDQYNEEYLKWKAQYYCRRCGILFLPNPSQTTSAIVGGSSMSTQGKPSVSSLKTVDPVEFEHYIKSLFEKLNYTVETTARTGDEGVDLRLRRGQRKAIVQCKRYDKSVSQSVVRDLYGVMIHEAADEAYLITTGSITMPAQTWARGKPIHLIDGIELDQWIDSLDDSTLPQPPSK